MRHAICTATKRFFFHWKPSKKIESFLQYSSNEQIVLAFKFNNYWKATCVEINLWCEIHASILIWGVFSIKTRIDGLISSE